jgi:hypothetical protein
MLAQPAGTYIHIILEEVPYELYHPSASDSSIEPLSPLTVEAVEELFFGPAGATMNRPASLTGTDDSITDSGLTR